MKRDEIKNKISKKNKKQIKINQKKDHNWKKNQMGGQLYNLMDST
jgi:hypothetical protein